MIAIAAMSENRVIGKDGKIPWHLPEDLEFFKKTTMGHVVLMGRKTWESIGSKPLPGRVNVVASRTDIPGVLTFARLRDLDEFLFLPKQVYLIGGADIYRQCIPWCTHLYLTVVSGKYQGDAFFPEFLYNDVEIIEKHPQFEIRKYTL